MTESTVFFGSGPVAARSLELLSLHTEIEAIITKPRLAHHHGSVPVLEYAEQHDIPTYTANTKSELDDLITDLQFKSRYAVLIDFGIIVSQRVIDAFEFGIINSHFSLLPELRGADPITHTILNGDGKTGVSLMLVDRGMDTGKLIASKTLHLDGAETTPTLTERLILLSDELLQAYIPRYIAGDVTARAQPHPDRATYSHKLTKSDGDIDWNQSAEVIERQIRAYTGWPQSRTRLGDLDAIITAAELTDATGTPGTFSVDGEHLIIYAAKGALSIERIKPSGKKEMPIRAFLTGYHSRLGV